MASVTPTVSTALSMMASTNVSLPVFADSLSASLAAALAEALVLAPEPPRSFLAQPVPLKWIGGRRELLAHRPLRAARGTEARARDR